MRKYRHVADFLTVYISEAHATDGEWPRDTAYSIKEHTALKDRLEATQQLQELGLEGELAVDTMDNDFGWWIYSGMPERLFVVDRGLVKYVGGMGPHLYNLGEVEKVLVGLGKRQSNGSATH